MGVFLRLNLLSLPFVFYIILSFASAEGLSILFFFFFNWRLNNLQYCGGFCYTST